MVTYVCDRCQFTFSRKSHFTRHLRRKYPCTPKIREISLEAPVHQCFADNGKVKFLRFSERILMAPKLTPNDSELTPNDSELTPSLKKQRLHLCLFCQKSYSKNSNMHRHMRGCKKKGQPDDSSLRSSFPSSISAEASRERFPHNSHTKIEKTSPSHPSAGSSPHESGTARASHASSEFLADSHTNPHTLEVPAKSASLAERPAHPCSRCGRPFSRSDSVKRHEKKYCTRKKTSKARQPTIHNTNNNHNTTNNTNNVTINNITNNIVLSYENTDPSHLTDGDYHFALSRASRCVPEILERVHFNPSHPENRNVCLRSLNSSYINVHDGEKFKVRRREDMINDLLADGEYLLETKLENWQENADHRIVKAKKKYKVYQEMKEKFRPYQNLKQDVAIMLYNNRDIASKTSEERLGTVTSMLLST